MLPNGVLFTVENIVCGDWCNSYAWSSPVRSWRSTQSNPPPVNVGPIVGCGRGDWRPLGMKGSYGMSGWGGGTS
ncbi:hypothetical protein H5410_036042 [Solanum commersonii]|uniref:Uncharacterized protein n=1 Tax=Solanum commersonii TaxID=4109 RepID=A0A9J5Y496_SOLCO|nr:hypothetical protein H5410_036042 [Solanum commersonii]